MCEGRESTRWGPEGHCGAGCEETPTSVGTPPFPPLSGLLCWVVCGEAGTGTGSTRACGVGSQRRSARLSRRRSPSSTTSPSAPPWTTSVRPARLAGHPARSPAPALLLVYHAPSLFARPPAHAALPLPPLLSIPVPVPVRRQERGGRDPPGLLRWRRRGSGPARQPGARRGAGGRCQSSWPPRPCIP